MPRDAAVRDVFKYAGLTVPGMIGAISISVLHACCLDLAF